MKAVTFESCLPTVPHLVRDLVRREVVVTVLDLALVREMVAEAVVEEKKVVEAVESERRPPTRQSIVVAALVRVLVRRHVVAIVIALDLVRTRRTTIARTIQNARVTTPPFIDPALDHTLDQDRQ